MEHTYIAGTYTELLQGTHTWQYCAVHTHGSAARYTRMAVRTVHTHARVALPAETAARARVPTFPRRNVPGTRSPPHAAHDAALR